MEAVGRVQYVASVGSETGPADPSPTVEAFHSREDLTKASAANRTSDVDLQHETSTATESGISWKPMIMIGCFLMLIIFSAVYNSVHTRRRLSGHNSFTRD